MEKFNFSIQIKNSRKYTLKIDNNFSSKSSIENFDNLPNDFFKNGKNN